MIRQTKWIALLGRRDEPVDGVEDYCAFLGKALLKQRVDLEWVRVPWTKMGVRQAMRDLSRRGIDWRDRWVLVQYTALAWSRRGFPFPALRAVRWLRSEGARVAVVFHEHERQGDAWPRLIDKMRGRCQDWIIRRLYRAANKCIFAEPLGNIAWLPKSDVKSTFVPIGANIPEIASQPVSESDLNGKAKSVAVFCLTEPPKRDTELAQIAHATRVAASHGVTTEVRFVGRGTEEAREEIGRAFQGTPTEISVLGLRSAQEIAHVLAQSDAMLCVRGKATLQRGSVIAGIACGVPIVGYAGGAEGTPLIEAGIELVSANETDALGAALTRILTNPQLRDQLRERSLRAQRLYFSWDAIASRFVSALAT